MNSKFQILLTGVGSYLPKKKISNYIIKNDFKFLTIKKQIKLIKEKILNERSSIRY